MSQSKKHIEYLSKEKIIWKGTSVAQREPKRSYFFKALDYLTTLIDGLKFLFMLLVSAFLYYLEIIDFNAFLIYVLFLILIILLLVGCIFLEQRSMSKVKYIVTDMRIIFQSWKIFKGIDINTINLTDILNMSLEEFDNDMGTIYFLGSNFGKFKNSEHHPALICINGVNALMEKLVALVKCSKS